MTISREQVIEDALYILGIRVKTILASRDHNALYELDECVEYWCDHIEGIYNNLPGIKVEPADPLFIEVCTFELSVRAHNCLKYEGLKYLGDVVQKTESELMKIPNFGKLSLQELKTALEYHEMYLNTPIANWEEKKKQHEAKVANDR